MADYEPCKKYVNVNRRGGFGLRALLCAARIENDAMDKKQLARAQKTLESDPGYQRRNLVDSYAPEKKVSLREPDEELDTFWAPWRCVCRCGCRAELGIGEGSRCKDCRNKGPRHQKLMQENQGHSDRSSKSRSWQRERCIGRKPKKRRKVSFSTSSSDSKSSRHWKSDQKISPDRRRASEGRYRRGGKISQDQRSALDDKISPDCRSASEGKISQTYRRAPEEKMSQDQRSASDDKISQDQRSASEGKISQDYRSASEGKISQDYRSASEGKISQDYRSASEGKISQDYRSASEGKISQDYRRASEGKISQDQRSASEGTLSSNDSCKISSNDSCKISSDEWISSGDSCNISDDESSLEGIIRVRFRNRIHRKVRPHAINI